MVLLSRLTLLDLQFLFKQRLLLCLLFQNVLTRKSLIAMLGTADVWQTGLLLKEYWETELEVYFGGSECCLQFGKSWRDGFF